MEKLIHDFDGTEDYSCSDEIKVLCHLENAEWVACKIVRDLGYKRKDPYKPNPHTSYQITDDLYEFLDELIQSEDCKNGVQIYQDTDTKEYYLQITGRLFYDRDNNVIINVDKVKVYFKEFVW